MEHLKYLYGYQQLIIGETPHKEIKLAWLAWQIVEHARMVLIYKDYFYQTVASEPDHHLILKILGKSCRDSFDIFNKQTLLFFMFILKN